MEVGIFTKRNKSQNRVCCAVIDCNSKANKNLDLVFHKFPKAGERTVLLENYFGNLEKVDKFKAWKKLLKINQVTSRMKICSLHFKKTDYILPDYNSGRKTLKKIAVPSCNLPKLFGVKNTVQQESRLKKRQERHGISKKMTLKKTSVPSCNLPSCKISEVEKNKEARRQRQLNRIPRDKNKRPLWLKAAQVDINEYSPNSALYCCIDHFIYKEDVENWLKYELLNGNIKIRLKPGVIPHIFKREENKTTNNVLSKTTATIDKRTPVENYDERISFSNDKTIQVQCTHSYKTIQTSNLFNRNLKVHKTNAENPKIYRRQKQMLKQIIPSQAEAGSSCLGSETIFLKNQIKEEFLQIEIGEEQMQDNLNNVYIPSMIVKEEYIIPDQIELKRENIKQEICIKQEIKEENFD